MRLITGGLYQGKREFVRKKYGITPNDIFDVEGSIEPIKQAINDNVSTMIVFRFPEIAKVLYDRIPDLQKKLMIGPVQKRDDTIEVRAGTYVTREEVNLLDELAEEKGVEIFFQVVPDMKRIEFADFKKTLASGDIDAAKDKLGAVITQFNKLKTAKDAQTEI